MNDVTGHDMSRFWRLVSVKNGLVTGTFWVSRPNDKRDEQIVKAVDVLVWHEKEHYSGRVINDMTAFIRGGEVDLPPHMIREQVRDDVLAKIDEVKVAILAAAAAVTWTDEPRAD